MATAYESEVELRDVATGARVGLLDAHTDNARAVAFSPDGATVVTGAADGTLRLWNPRNSHLRATLPPPRCEPRHQPGHPCPAPLRPARNP